MSTILDVIRQILPRGTVLQAPDGQPAWDECPFWPPDLFAIAATLVERGSIYTRPWMYAAPSDERDHPALTSKHAGLAVKAGATHRTTGTSPYAQRRWKLLVRRYGGCPVSALADRSDRRNARLQRIVVQLMCVADEAAEGIGFPVDHRPGNGMSPVSVAARLAHDAFVEAMRHPGHDPQGPLPHLPHSLCSLVPDHVACVLPKTTLPSVGCTLRGLSRNLALLPSCGIVKASWLLASNDTRSAPSDRLNLLIIPFPFDIDGQALTPIPSTGADRAQYFSINFGGYHLPANVRTLASARETLKHLIARATAQIGTIHGVVFPEYAMADRLARPLARSMARDHPGLEIVVAGTLGRASENAPLASNLALIARFENGQRLRTWSQSKHHRWKLDPFQIRRYQMGHALDVNHDWWECIDIDQRVCNFSIIRNRLSLAVLICEDLARMDPVMPVVHAIGPSLVIALLMDGPQLEARWCGRYATALAEDPGSSVLSVTSTALIHRSAGKRGNAVIALWKEAGGLAQELAIGADDHGLALSLARVPRELITLDGRTSRDHNRHLSLVSACPVRL